MWMCVKKVYINYILKSEYKNVIKIIVLRFNFFV
jgi:hypothetical protein